MIRIEGISKAFGGNIVLNGVSLHVGEGEIFGLVGPDGAGKTTLMRIVCGLIAPDRGRVFLGGRLQGGQSASAGSPHLGYMPQRFSLYGDLTVQENIDFFGAMYDLPKRTVREHAGEMLAITKLAPFVRRLAGNLSGGMKQKLALTCALITRPEVLVLDEPTYGVDPESRQDFWMILYRLNSEGGCTILISTPYMDEAELCSTVAFMDSSAGTRQAGALVIGSPLRLKRSFPHRLLEVRADSRDPRLFDNLPGILKASLFGDRYHLTATDAGLAGQAIAGRLAERKIAAGSVREIRPSMEDVFVALAEGRAP